MLGFQGFLWPAPAASNSKHSEQKEPEVDTKNPPDFMQYKITCVQLEKNSANYLHRRDIHLSQTVSFGNISLFSLRQNISSYVTISPDYFQKCSGWLITITFYFTFYFVRRNSWGLQKLDKCHFLLAIMVLVFVFKLIKLSCFHLTICHFVLLTHSTLPALPGQNLYRWWWRKDLTRD